MDEVLHLSDDESSPLNALNKRWTSHSRPNGHRTHPHADEPAIIIWNVLNEKRRKDNEEKSEEDIRNRK